MTHTFPASLFDTVDLRLGIAMLAQKNDPDEATTPLFRQALASTDPS
jgi:hypothetical protein